MKEILVTFSMCSCRTNVPGSLEWLQGQRHHGNKHSDARSVRRIARGTTQRPLAGCANGARPSRVDGSEQAEERLGVALGCGAHQRHKSDKSGRPPVSEPDEADIGTSCLKRKMREHGLLCLTSVKIWTRVQSEEYVPIDWYSTEKFVYRFGIERSRTVGAGWPGPAVRHIHPSGRRAGNDDRHRRSSLRHRTAVPRTLRFRREWLAGLSAALSPKVPAARRSQNRGRRDFGVARISWPPPRC
jgi:hypothetical protein